MFRCVHCLILHFSAVSFNHELLQCVLHTVVVVMLYITKAMLLWGAAPGGDNETNVDLLKEKRRKYDEPHVMLHCDYGGRPGNNSMFTASKNVVRGQHEAN